MMGWQWHQLHHMQIICTLLQTDNQASTSPQAGCPSCHPTNSVKALKAKSEDFSFYINMNAHFITSTTTKVADTWIRDFAMRSDTNRPHHSMDITLTQRHSKLPHCAPGNTVLHRYCIYICLSAFFQDNLGKSAPER